MVWQPGQSGNPAGMPPRVKKWRDALERALLRQHVLILNEGLRTVAQLPIDADAKGRVIVPEGRALELIADMTVQQALCGDLAARKEIGDRLDGRAAQTIEGGDVPLIHSVRWLDSRDIIEVDDPEEKSDG